MSSNYAPIAIFVYNRPDHTKRLIESLLKNPEAANSELFIFSDGPKSEADVPAIALLREYLKTIGGFARIEIQENKRNIGLAYSIMGGVDLVFTLFEQIIVLEDDLEVSPYFLDYMNRALQMFADNDKVFSISGYSAPIHIPENYKHNIFTFHRINSWGWATWRDRWKSVDWLVKDFPSFIRNKNFRSLFNQVGKDVTVMLMKQQREKIDSWAIRFNFAAFKQQKLTVYPVKSLVQNNGADGTGQNVEGTNKYLAYMTDAPIVFTKLVPPDHRIVRRYRKFFNPSVVRQLINYFKIQIYLRAK